MGGGADDANHGARVVAQGDVLIHRQLLLLMRVLLKVLRTSMSPGQSSELMDDMLTGFASPIV